ncbi:MAG: P pilus assembly chaperone PapD [Candidatus Azotimanducaceae bacterium]|jgi:P pilus assembly chaperone PapD
MKLLSLVILLLLTCLQCETAKASLLVDKAIVVFDEKTGDKLDVTVINDDAEEKLYVKVEAFEVQAPGTSEENLVAFDKMSVPTFIATPNKLVVQAGGKSLIRLMNLNQTSDVERIYRINFMPITRPIELMEAEEQAGVRSMLEILIAYQVLAIVLPIDPVATPLVQRNKTLVTIKNSGNANFLLTHGRQCNPTDPSECKELPHKRVYPGNTWELNLPYDGQFSYDIQTHEGNSPSLFQ